MASIGERIRKARQMNGYTQSQLASKLGCSSNTISRWEHDKTVPSANDIEDLSKILDANFTEDIPGSLPSLESNVEDIRLELQAARKVNRTLVVVMMIVLLCITVFLCWFVFGFERIDPDSPNQPCTVIYYDVKEEEDVL